MSTQTQVDPGEFFRDYQAWVKSVGDFRAVKATPLARKLLDLIFDDDLGAETVGDALDLVRRSVSRGSN
jgi:hypothetical protein